MSKPPLQITIQFAHEEEGREDCPRIYMTSAHDCDTAVDIVMSGGPAVLTRAQMVLINRLAQDFEAHLVALAKGQEAPDASVVKQPEAWPRICFNCKTTVYKEGRSSYVLKGSSKCCPFCGEDIERQDDTATKAPSAVSCLTLGEQEIDSRDWPRTCRNCLVTIYQHNPPTYVVSNGKRRCSSCMASIECSDLRAADIDKLAKEAHMDETRAKQHFETFGWNPDISGTARALRGRQSTYCGPPDFSGGGKKPLEQATELRR